MSLGVGRLRATLPPVVGERDRDFGLFGWRGGTHPSDQMKNSEVIQQEKIDDVLAKQDARYDAMSAEEREKYYLKPSVTTRIKKAIRGRSPRIAPECEGPAAASPPLTTTGSSILRRVAPERRATRSSDPRFSPNMIPASARILVWCEMVGWLLPQWFFEGATPYPRLRTATSDSKRSRTGITQGAKDLGDVNRLRPRTSQWPQGAAATDDVLVNGDRLRMTACLPFYY